MDGLRTKFLDGIVTSVVFAVFAILLLQWLVRERHMPCSAPVTRNNVEQVAIHQVFKNSVGLGYSTIDQLANAAEIFEDHRYHLNNDVSTGAQKWRKYRRVIFVKNKSDSRGYEITAHFGKCVEQNEIWSREFKIEDYFNSLKLYRQLDAKKSTRSN